MALLAPGELIDIRQWKCSHLFIDLQMKGLSPKKLCSSPLIFNFFLTRLPLYKTAMLYGAETWATTKRQEKQLEVNKMRMLRWMCGVTRKDKIRNEHIRGTTRVAQASKKITERRLIWYGHVMRRDGEHILRKVLRADIPGKRKRGRPKTRWKDACQ